MNLIIIIIKLKIIIIIILVCVCVGNLWKRYDVLYIYIYYEIGACRKYNVGYRVNNNDGDDVVV